jgi:drug/metabolite transporter (DMT)-like permease
MPPRAMIATALLCILFGGNAVAIKFSLTGIGLFTNIGLRFSIAALALLLWAKWAGKTPRLRTEQVWPLALLSVLFTVQIGGFYAGLSRTAASHAILISNVLPFVVTILAHYLLPGERIVPRKIVGMLLGFGGVALLFGDAAAMSREVLLGDLVVFCSVLVWGCSAILLKRLSATIHPLALTLYPMVFSGPFYLVCGWLMDGVMIRSLDSAVLAAMFYQSLITAAFGFVIWNTLIKNYGASTVHAYVFLMPISGVLLGVLLLGEPLTGNLLGAIALVTVGLIVQHRGKKRVLRPYVEQQ